MVWETKLVSPWERVPIEKHLFVCRWDEAVPQSVISNFVALVDENRDGKLQFHEFVELQRRFLPQCRGYCHDCNDILINEEPQTCNRGGKELTLCFWCAEHLDGSAASITEVKPTVKLSSRALQGLEMLTGAISSHSSNVWDMTLGRILGVDAMHSSSFQSK